ncbi:hypothetical protein [Kosmotoga pacifica]|uniref:CopG family transcriptional regulator n=1 Tax=Kosmotoga pacifica TaxID=1330330 RepID=A0A0G2Z7H8_9BACT|nr:hypothetical protein [Kosmotoga pacifica]AKI97550.1 hypothetical protein IX53_06665 [Kosmotoga pacifica]
MDKLPIKTVMVVMVDHRKEVATKVQQILTGWGCLIKTRLGLHDGVLDNCSDVGLIILELVGEEKQHQELCRKLNLLDGVKAKYISLSFDD